MAIVTKLMVWASDLFAQKHHVDTVFCDKETDQRYRPVAIT